MKPKTPHLTKIDRLPPQVNGIEPRCAPPPLPLLRLLRLLRPIRPSLRDCVQLYKHVTSFDLTSRDQAELFKRLQKFALKNGCVVRAVKGHQAQSVAAAETPKSSIRVVSLYCIWLAVCGFKRAAKKQTLSVKGM